MPVEVALTKLRLVKIEATELVAVIFPTVKLPIEDDAIIAPPERRSGVVVAL